MEQLRLTERQLRLEGENHQRQLEERLTKLEQHLYAEPNTPIVLLSAEEALSETSSEVTAQPMGLQSAVSTLGRSSFLQPPVQSSTASVNLKKIQTNSTQAVSSSSNVPVPITPTSGRALPLYLAKRAEYTISIQKLSGKSVTLTVNDATTIMDAQRWLWENKHIHPGKYHILR